MQAYEHQNGKEVFQLRLKYGAKEERSDPQAPPPFNLEQIFQDLRKVRKTPAKTTWGRITAYSRNVNLLKVWRVLQTLADKGDSPWTLVLHDATPYGIPWEMLRFNEERYLGAAFNLVRELPVATFQEHAPASGPLRRRGTVRAYILPSLKKATEETAFFQNVPDTEVCSDIKEMYPWLNRKDKDCALFYLACHGLYENDSLQLGCVQDKKQRLTYEELETYDLPGIKCGVVFINACYSARRQADKVYQDGYLRSFPELFLNKGAHGVISTLVSVPDAYAAEVAQALLQKIRQPDAAPLPALLRELRQEAQSRLKLGADDTTYLWALNVFCYAYYGHPWLSLDLGADA